MNKKNSAVVTIALYKPIIFFLLFIIFTSFTNIYSQEIETDDESAPENSPAPQKRNVYVDAGYAALGVFTSNMFMHLGARMGGETFANMTFQKMWDNISTNRWIIEDRDRFLVNQFCHPYHASTYFASARVNGFNFYESMIFVPLGSLMWEVLLEPSPAVNDFITTSVSGMALGEILHRLFLEVNSSPSVGAKIGGFFVSPLSSFNGIYNRPVRETGGGNIYSLQFGTGIEKTFAFFPGHENQQNSWDYPGGNINFNVVYGDPYIKRVKKPYENFELYASLTSNGASYHAALASDGYIFTLAPAQTDNTFTSSGLSMHLDFFNATNDLIDNRGYGNIQYSSNAIGWSFKHKRVFSENSHIEAKAHAAYTFWGNSMYNADDVIDDDYWIKPGNHRFSYGMGENVKLSFLFYNKKAGKFEIAALGYHMFSFKLSEIFSKGNVLFLYSFLRYDFPLGKKIGIGVKETFYGLLGFYDSAENVRRILASSCLYANFTF